MSYTSRSAGIGGRSQIRRLAKQAQRSLQRDPLTPNGRNSRRLIKKLRAKHGDEAVDRQFAMLEKGEVELSDLDEVPTSE